MDEKKLSIKEWAEADRPREKFVNKGINSLSDAELIAILIGSGNTKESAVELSMRILNDLSNNLHELGRLGINELTSYKGIGSAKAISIIAALELGKRRKLSDIINKKQIDCSKDSYEYFYTFLSDLQHEEFWIMFLNQANKIISSHKISQGGQNSTIINVKIIMKIALEKSAMAIVLSHNHPSGNRQPSKADQIITNKIQDAASLFDIKVLDHIIIADNKYFSFADNGLIKEIKNQ